MDLEDSIHSGPATSAPTILGEKRSCASALKKELPLAWEHFDQEKALSPNEEMSKICLIHFP